MCVINTDDVDYVMSVSSPITTSDSFILTIIGCIIIMGVLVGTVFHFVKLLTEITEIEEVGHDISPTAKHRADKSESSTPRRQKSRKLARRSLSLPSGHLSYSDNVKISYVNGHFVAKNQGEDNSVSGNSVARNLGADNSINSNFVVKNPGADNSVNSQFVAKNPRGDNYVDREGTGAYVDRNEEKESSPCDFKQINSMREEILSLLNKGLSTSDNTLGDWNFNHVPDDLDNPSLTSSTLPRRRQKDGNPGQRPVSVDESQLWRLSSHSESSLCSDDLEIETERHNQDDNISIASSRYDSRYSSQLSVDEDTKRSKSPNFFKRMLSKRKSFSEKSKSKDEVFANGAGKDGSLVRRMSLRSIFKRKGSTSSRKESDSDDPSSPPIVGFLTTEDIGAIQDSPYIFKRPNVPENSKTNASDKSVNSRKLVIEHPTLQTNHVDQLNDTQSDQSNSIDQSQTRLAHHTNLIDQSQSRVAHPSNLSDQSQSRLAHQSNLSDQSQSRLAHQTNSSDQSAVREGNKSPNHPPPKPSSAKPEISPRRKGSVCSMRQEVGGETDRDRQSGEFSDVDYIRDSVNSDGTLSPHSSSSHNSSVVTLDGDETITDCDTTLTYQNCHTLSPLELDKLVQGELTGSHSNDSGIQHDLLLQNSSDSLQKVLNDPSVHINTSVRLRKSPSPHRERPKSDTTYTVRWADLLENVPEEDNSYSTRDGKHGRRKQRPKSDLEDMPQFHKFVCKDEDDLDNVFSEGGSSLYMSHMKVFGGSMGNLGPSDSLRSLVELRRHQQEYGAKAAQLVKNKNRRMSTPHPIKSREEKKSTRHQRMSTLVRSHSMPESLDKLHRRKNFLSLIGVDTSSMSSQSGVCDDSSDESEMSEDFSHQEKCRSTRGSQLTLATLDEYIEEENLIYAEALWDHVTLDTDELSFRAGDVVQVTDAIDKDWWFGVIDERQGWFPATFVRLRVNQSAVEEEMTMLIHEESENAPKLRHHGISYIDKNQARTNVINEIINAEREYSKHLKDVVEGYVKQARKRPEMFSAEKITTMFGNIEEIYAFASKFLEQLETHINTASPHLSEVGQTFLDNSKRFEIYSDYCNNHPSACDELKEIYRNKRYRHFFEACRLLQDMIEIPLEGFLLTPVQKICKYHLQLAELLKYTPQDHPDHGNVKGALEAMKKIATLINERKRKMESIEKITSWQMAVDAWEGPDLLDISSELIYSGELNKINSSGWSQERYFFLFDHQVVYCKKDMLKKNSFCYKGRVNLDQCEVIPIEDGKDVQYNVTVRHAWKLHDTTRDKWYLLVAKSDAVKQRWLKAFQDERKRVKDDQENNFNIPAHIRDKAINNVKQKTNLQRSKGFLLWLSRR